MVASGSGVSEPDQPAGLSGLASGAVKDWACTVTGPRPASRKPRIIETAW